MRKKVIIINIKDLKEFCEENNKKFLDYISRGYKSLAFVNNCFVGYMGPPGKIKEMYEGIKWPEQYDVKLYQPKNERILKRLWNYT